MAHFVFKRSPSHKALQNLDAREVIEMSDEDLIAQAGSLGTAAAIRAAFVAHIIKTRATFHDLRNVIKTLEKRIVTLEREKVIIRR